MTIVKIPLTVIDSDEDIQKLAMSALIKGANPSFLNDSVSYPIEQKYLELDHAKYCYSQGATITSYPLFVEIDPTSDVPDGIPNATYTNESDEEMRHTWETWCLPNHSIMNVADRNFIGTNANSGDDLPLGDLVPVFDDLIHPNELIDLIAEENPTEID